MQLLLATTNEGKIQELRQLLSDSGLEVVGLGDRAVEEEIETGATFKENALLKAQYYHRMTSMPTIADDSGLEVDALDGAPGVYSARYGGPTDADRTGKLLEEIRDVPEERRGARFVCAAAIAWDGGERVFEDEARGVLLYHPRGQGGFGYDPIFFYPPLGKTFAELTREEKERVSHRGRAFRRLVAWLSSNGIPAK
ncbi:MAG TPA: RdgB/HAM1 family non-canonical purine NTP pyrophosphatase [Blastocatellia bacterium]|jgi:XTP/dITP diphosphohydrolase